MKKLKTSEQISTETGFCGCPSKKAPAYLIIQQKNPSLFEEPLLKLTDSNSLLGVLPQARFTRFLRKTYMKDRAPGKKAKKNLRGNVRGSTLIETAHPGQTPW